MKIALGSAQFGMKYGVASSNKQVGENALEDILNIAWKANILFLDTAKVYGNSEKMYTKRQRYINT